MTLAVGRQIWLRIKVSVAAYAYEFESDSIISDAEFDRLCLEVDPSIKTGNTELDNFFSTEFDPSTGQWIHKHPQIKGISRIYHKYYKKKTCDG
jgi:hypothetical protein